MADTSGVDLNSLRAENLWLLKHEYIADYLAHDPAPAADSYLLPDCQPPSVAQANQVGNMDVSVAGKRKAARGQETNSRSSKRTKH